jgi:energy-converting hydrogenase A subunit M
LTTKGGRQPPIGGWAASMSARLKTFGMQSLMVEADLSRLERDGVDLGHARTLSTKQVVDVELFEADILRQARKMADFYVIYYSLENTIRRLIRGVLHEVVGVDWWTQRVPEGVRNSVADKQAKEKDSVMAIRSDDPMAYTNFGELIDILNANWDDFADGIRSKKAMQQTLSQMNQVRNIIAHSCELPDDEITRFELLVRDWLRIQA